MPANAFSAAAHRMTLTDLPIGAAGRVCELSGHAEFCQRLREMGVCESVVIEKISGRGTLLCQLCNARIALSDRAARHIVVEIMQGEKRWKG
ncbi:MAG: ferrous iron transport protein A [Opitutaceae bacterium]|nr:ferrous iron transport protein A [Opitutaceae bacterium]